jgi:hypothetical protein
LWGGADPLTSNNPALNAARTQWGSECARRAVAVHVAL